MHTTDTPAPWAMQPAPVTQYYPMMRTTDTPNWPQDPVNPPIPNDLHVCPPGYRVGVSQHGPICVAAGQGEMLYAEANEQLALGPTRHTPMPSPRQRPMTNPRWTLASNPPVPTRPGRPARDTIREIIARKKREVRTARVVDAGPRPSCPPGQWAPCVGLKTWGGQGCTQWGACEPMPVWA